MFEPKQQKIFIIVGNTGDVFLPVIHYNSPQTKCNGYTVTVGYGPSGIAKSYLGIKCTKQSRYSLHRFLYFSEQYHY